MVKVGIRKLKDGLSSYVRRSERGEEFVVTDRGRAVARLAAADWDRTSSEARSGMTDLVRRGLLTRGSGNDPSRYRVLPRLTRRTTSAELLDQEREER